jgi:lipopolysaccharide transport protein LptA
MMRALVALLLLACAGGTPAEPAPLPGHSAFTGLQLALPARALVLRAARAELAGPGRGMAETVTAEAGADPALSIRAARASWDLAGQSVVFEGAVEVERGGFTLTCERLEARFESPERLESAEATGQVSVRHRGRVATGQRASLDVPAGRIELTGEPRIREGGRTLAGERIVLLLDAERLECERCTLQVTATPGEAP